MKLIVGLGNPGKEYEKTRHNVGFMVVDKILSQNHPLIKRGEAVFLEPKAFMNHSGIEVAKLARYYKITPQDIWVISDDFMLELGAVRVRIGGSSGGHNGLQSIIDELKSDAFVRFRVGLGCNAPNNAHDFVLSPFTKEEQPVIAKAVDQCAELVIQSLEKGIEPTTLVPATK